MGKDHLPSRVSVRVNLVHRCSYHKAQPIASKELVSLVITIYDAVMIIVVAVVKWSLEASVSGSTNLGSSLTIIICQL